MPAVPQVAPDASPCSLWDALDLVADPRSASGRRHPLKPMLGLLALATLAGMRSLLAVAEFGRAHGSALAAALGFTRPETPCVATFHYLLKALDVGAYEAALRRWAAGRVSGGWTPVAVDGKSLCGATGERLPGVHLVAAFAHDAGVALAQVRVDAKTNEHKAALELLGMIDLKGKVVTGDAMFCQRETSQAVLDAGGDYVWRIKENQKTLLGNVASAFDDRGFSPLRAAARQGRARPARRDRQGSRPTRTP